MPCINKTTSQWPLIGRLNRLFLCIYLCTVVFSTKAGAQGCPPNLDFEMGTFDNWQCYVGAVSGVGGQNTMTLNPSPPTPGRHDIIPATLAGNDFYGNFPTICPYGGNYSVKLGNDDVGAKAEAISYTFTVPANQDTFTFTYFYAVVFENPSHNIYEQPRFFVTAYDVLTGNLISCASYDYVSTSGLPGFEVSLQDPNVLYKKWSPVSIQFAGLANRQVRLEFRTGDCTRGGHFGYAYIDVSSGCTDILATAPYCVETNSLVLNAPYGFQSYTWYNSNYSQVLGTGQSITLSPPPATLGTFYVDMIPYPGYGCRDTAGAIVTPFPVPDTPVAVSYYEYCQNAVAATLTATALPAHDLYWYTTPVGGTPSSIPITPPTGVPGIFEYYVIQKTLFGCESKRKKITVNIIPIPVVVFNTNGNNQCIYNNNFVFTSTSSGLFNPQYVWDFGDGQTATTASATHTYTSPGNYTVRLRITNQSGCSAEKTIQVVVHQRPVAVMSTPPVICEGQTQVTLTDNSFIPGGVGQLTSWWWNLNGNIVTAQNPPSFTININTPFPARLVAHSAAGCVSDTALQVLQVRRKPIPAFRVGRALCENELLQFTDQSFMPAGATGELVNRWNWQFDNTGNSSLQNPTYQFNTGAHRVRLTATSNFGCNSNLLDTLLTIHPKPAVSAILPDSCAGKIILFAGQNLSGTVNKWYWNFGGGFTPGAQNEPRLFNRAATGTLQVAGETIHGCRDTFSRVLEIFDNLAFAGNDTSGPVNEPVQLNARGGASMQYQWSPNTGLNNTTIENPVATLDRNQRYFLTAISDKGCVKRSSVHILRYKGPDIYVPTAFTPDGDGVNDIFRAVAYGVIRFDYLVVYNRYGNEVFRTSDIRRGWDGTYKGVAAQPDAYVFQVRGFDFKNREIFKKGTVVLIR